jgi:hypothetical protein
MIEYRDIIKYHIREAVKKKKKAEDESTVRYWEWVIGQLISDLRDYEGGERWMLEPYDSAWSRYHSPAFPSVDDIIRRFFEDFYF